ncbi:MAG TPA: prolipoprotein diacylglyceryl transferase, partial [Alphaproteobacteria bacterium]|nr:prolipoprotein diacylglyceryl transferase [Alphaproteobacteria bacterium]
MTQCIPPFTLIDPIIFEIGPFALRWYAVAYIAGLLLGWRYMVALSRRPKLYVPKGIPPRGTPFNVEDIDDLLLWVTIGVVAGGRLGYVLFYQTDAIWERPLWVFTGIVEGGMSFHGGLIGVALALFFTCRARKLDLFRVADAAAVVTPIGLFFGRVANFINGELWGRPTELPWGMQFAGDPSGACRH